MRLTLSDVASESQWRAYETASWRYAARERGLRFTSLDPDELDAVLASLEWSPRRRSRLHLRLRGKFAKHLRGFSMIAFLAIGYSIHDIAQTSVHVVNALNATRHLATSRCSMNIDRALALPDSDLTALEQRCE